MTGVRNLQTGFKQPITLGRAAVPVPGTAMKRGGTAAGGRPMTAVSGAGFSSNKGSISGSADFNGLGIQLDPKIETYVLAPHIPSL